MTLIYAPTQMALNGATFFLINKFDRVRNQASSPHVPALNKRLPARALRECEAVELIARRGRARACERVAPGTCYWPPILFISHFYLSFINLVFVYILFLFKFYNNK